MLSGKQGILSGEVTAFMKAEKKSKVWPPRAMLQEVQRPIPEEVYPVLDTDLARDNLENDLPAADLEEL